MIMMININKISIKDAEILSHLRNNARKKITCISKEVKTPVTTIYDKVKSHEKKGIIKKNVTLLDFSKIGYNTSAFIALKAHSANRSNLQDFLTNHPNVNSLYRTGMDDDFIIECIFTNQAKMQDFLEHIQFKFEVQQPRIFSIIEELKKEHFLTDPTHIEEHKGDDKYDT
jgi:DNA-binding Lrp family transcriptional regulator